MEATEVARYAFTTIIVLLLILLLGPYFLPQLPQQALIKLSFFNLPSNVSKSFVVTPGSLAFWTIWAAIASFAALGVDLLMFFKLSR